MSYKQNASANRDALFGSSGGGSKKKKGGSKPKASNTNRDAALGTPTSTGSKQSSDTLPTSKGYKYGGTKNKSPITTSLSGEAKAGKMKEAEDYRDKAKKSMQKGIFAKQDPLAASTYYKRAADAYQLCGEDRLERLYRINSADCQSMYHKRSELGPLSEMHII
jgi:hypothetical protein